MVVGILAFLLAGVAFISRAYGISATPPGHTGYQSVLSQMVGAVTGRGGFYFVIMTAVLTVLALPANTRFGSSSNPARPPQSRQWRGRRGAVARDYVRRAGCRDSVEPPACRRSESVVIGDHTCFRSSRSSDRGRGNQNGRLDLFVH